MGSQRELRQKRDRGKLTCAETTSLAVPRHPAPSWLRCAFAGCAGSGLPQASATTSVLLDLLSEGCPR